MLPIHPLDLVQQETIWVFFPDLGDQQSSHARTSASTQGVAQLKALQAITTWTFGKWMEMDGFISKVRAGYTNYKLRFLLRGGCFKNR